MLFGFAALQAVIFNKALSLVVILTARPARLTTVPLSGPNPHWTLVAKLLARQPRRCLGQRVLGHPDALGHPLPRPGRAPGRHRRGTDRQPRRHALRHVTLAPAAVIIGVLAGSFIGAVAAIMGVAGGGILILTIVLLFGAGIKIAGSLSLAVSLPTMLGGLLLCVVPDTVLVPSLAVMLVLSSIKVWRHATTDTTLATYEQSALQTSEGDV